MRAFLDDAPIQADRPTLAAALASGVELAEAAGRIIVEVKLDGRDVPGDALERPSDDDVGNAEVRLVSADPRELASQALVDAVEQLDRTRKRQAECAECMQGGKLGDAMSLLSDCLGDWDTVRGVVQSVAQLLPVAPPGIERTADGLARRLEELKSALAGQDWATLADLLTYDLDEQAASWTRLIVEMREGVERQA